jgi:hypothetical protein
MCLTGCLSLAIFIIALLFVMSKSWLETPGLEFIECHFLSHSRHNKEVPLDLIV